MQRSPPICTRGRMMFHFKLVPFVSCLVMAVGAAISPSMASPFDDCRNGSAFAEPDKQFAVCDAALNAATDAKQKAFFQFKRGEALYWAEQHGQALADVNLAIEADPQLVPAYIRRAWIFILFRQWEDASRDIEEVLAQQPRNAEAIFALSFVYTSIEGNSERAFEAVRQAVEIDPGFHLARLNLAYKQYYRGDLGAMMKEFDTLLSHSEAELDKVSFRSGSGRQDIYPFGAHVRHERARFLMLARRDDQALPDINWLISHHPKISAPFVLRARILWGSDKIGALKDYGRAIEVDPYSVDARRERGWALLSLGKFDEAMADANWITETVSSAQSEGFHLRAKIAKKRGDREQALRDYEEAFRNDPQLLLLMQERLVGLGYVSRHAGNVYSEEIRNGVKACIADPEC